MKMTDFLLTALIGALTLTLAACGGSDSPTAAVSTSLETSLANQNTQTCAYVAGTPKGTLACDEKTYATVVIGTQTWMAENLNFTPATGNSWCYDNASSNCTTYGRLYDWATAKMVCPRGWHLPDTTEWNVLEDAVGGTSIAGTKLKANSTLWSSGGTDNHGFSALPGGNYDGTAFEDVGNVGNWWTATALRSTAAYSRSMFFSYAVVYHSSTYRPIGFSVRCLKD